MKSLTDSVGPGTTVVLLTIPAANNFVLTQVCHTTGTFTNFRIHNVGGGGISSQITVDNTSCQDYTPGVIFFGGDDVEFRNNSSSDSVRVLVNGILTKK
jgi:hypothetical protein